MMLDCFFGMNVTIYQYFLAAMLPSPVDRDGEMPTFIVNGNSLALNERVIFNLSKNGFMNTHQKFCCLLTKIF